MTNNMYRVGDYVYFETSSSSPFQIRRIEELNKTSSGNVEAKVMCFYRRRDVSASLALLADRHQAGALDDDDSEGENTPALGVSGAVNQYSPTAQNSIGESETLTSLDRHQLKHRELFLSRQIETLPATLIRGKCTVTLLNETESLLSYLNKEDTFFYSLVYDPQQKTLLADKGEIRIGVKYQTDITEKLKDVESDTRVMSELESLVWTPHHGLTDRQIDQFLVVSRSVGTFARALDCSSSVKQPSLHMSAAAASRDVTLFHAMSTLHQHSYELSKSLSSLVPPSGPVLCRDEMEEWSAAEANLFEEALEKYGKDFNDIRQDFLPWKSLKNIIEYYYMWKTTDRYVQQKRVKAVEAESKLKQVYIPNYNKSNPPPLPNGKPLVNGNTAVDEPLPGGNGKPCESCMVEASSLWYPWGPGHLQCRICSTCYQYWKRFGGLKMPSRMGREEERSSGGGGSRVHKCSVPGCFREYKTRSQLMRHAVQAHGLTLRPGSPRPIMKTRNAFYLHTSMATRIMRRLCPHIVQRRKSSRNPTWFINPINIRQDTMIRLGPKTFEDLYPILKSLTGKRKGKVSQVSLRLGQLDTRCPAWMLPTEVGRLPRQAVIAYPKPPKGPDGSLLYTPVPNHELPVMSSPPSLLKRRAYEETNGLEGHPHSKRMRDHNSATPPPPFHLSQLGVTPPPGLTVTPIGGVNGMTVSHSNITPPNSIPDPAIGVANLSTKIVSNSDIVVNSIIKPDTQIPIPPTVHPHTHPFSNMPNAAMNSSTHSGSGRAKIATVSRIAGRPRIISWMDAPDDVYFYSTDKTRKLRRSLLPGELKKAARKPWRKLSKEIKESDYPREIVAKSVDSFQSVERMSIEYPKSLSLGTGMHKEPQIVE